jgi:L-lactate dehydrogenase complex protein LldG
MSTPVSNPIAGGGRERVLADIRKSLGRTGASRDPIVPLPGSGPRPAFDGDPVERFVAKMLEKSATLVRIASLAEVGPEVARFVASVNGGRRLCVSNALAAVDWPPDFDVQHRAAVREDETSVTPCFAAVAESGGIVTLSGHDTPSTLNFVPDNHIVIVQATQVVRHFEDVWTRWRATGRPIPRTINIISGPSRTADIEQTIQLGAHGPRRLHILLLTA